MTGTLADRLRLAMARAEMNQKELADAVGVKPPSVNGWLSAKAKFLRGENLLKAAKVLGVSDVWLAEGKGSMVQGESQPERFNDETMAQAVELLHLLAETRPKDTQLQRPTWAMILIAAKAVQRSGGAPRKAIAGILAELETET